MREIINPSIVFHGSNQKKEEVDRIYDSVDEQGICRVNYCENALKGMGTYSGGQLEEDQRSKTRKLCDVTYRGVLILYYARRAYPDETVRNE